MKFNLTNVLLTALVILAILILYFVGCGNGASVQRIETTIHSDTTIHTKDSAVVSVPEKTKQYYTHTDSVIVMKFYYTDTNLVKKVVADYYATKTFHNTHKVDSLGTVDIVSTVSKNNVDSQRLTYNFKLPTITIS